MKGRLTGAAETALLLELPPPNENDESWRRDLSLPHLGQLCASSALDMGNSFSYVPPQVTHMYSYIGMAGNSPVSE
ncbi:MAG: hypothetical protein R3A10_21830 [Caldilineaceae bacterium]